MKLRVFDWSIRVKLPLWGSMLIIVTALTASVTMMFEIYDEMEEDLQINSQTLARVLRTDLFPAMQQDDVWRAFHVIDTALGGDAPARNPDTGEMRAQSILVLDNAQRVFVSTHPRTAPILSELRLLGPEYAALASHLGEMPDPGAREILLPELEHHYFVAPIAFQGTRLGTLVIVYPKGAVLPRFLQMARHGLIVGFVLLAVLIPLSWYWGQRMTKPLVALTARMGEIGRHELPADLDPGLYSHHDELGRLFQTYNRMLGELKIKDALATQMVQSERLAAVGRLAAGIAHEINNPLSGMLTAIDTLRTHGNMDTRTEKTVTLIERGLGQIRETVGALLVEARVKSRHLSAQDVEDVHTLIAPLARKRALRLTWRNELGADVPLPSTLVRQVLINLLLNAVQAAADRGEAGLQISCTDTALRLTVHNDGKVLTPEQIEHLFEPFSPLSETGHGLGLWVTYQIVHQLGGRISAAAVDNRLMRFSVSLPLGESV